MSKDTEFNEAEVRMIRQALDIPEDEPRKTPHDEAHEAHAKATSALKSAERAARRGDYAEAKKWNDLAKHQSETAERLARMELPLPSWEEEEQTRAKLQEILTKYCSAAHEQLRWELRREIWREMAAEAERTGGAMPPPMPPRPPHWSDHLPEDLRRKIHDDDP